MEINMFNISNIKGNRVKLGWGILCFFKEVCFGFCFLWQKLVYGERILLSNKLVFERMEDFILRMLF